MADEEMTKYEYLDKWTGWFIGIFFLCVIFTLLIIEEIFVGVTE